jgi:hypothetical protein
MNLSTFSMGQLNLFVHTLEGIYRQLDDISPAHLSEKDQKRRETMMTQVHVLEEQLTLEIAHLGLVELQGQLGTDESTTLEIAHHALVELQKQVRGEKNTTTEKREE